jgi:hypothetical protein
MKTPEFNIEATKYARRHTGYLPADDERYIDAYNHFKAGMEKAWTDATSQIEDLTKEVERLKFDYNSQFQETKRLRDVVFKLESSNDRYREALEEVVNRCNAAGGPDERFMDIIILDIRKYASSALHPLVKEGEK